MGFWSVNSYEVVGRGKNSTFGGVKVPLKDMISGMDLKMEPFS